MSHQAYFICGTDTDVGKTVISAALLKNIKEAQVLKVIQTGNELIDQAQYTEANPKSQVKTLKHFKLAASPHLSARLENQTLNLQSLAKEIQEFVQQAPFTIIEGSGGITTPITDSETFLDLIAMLPYPVILVVKNALGAINHASLSVMALKNHGIEIKGLIFTHPYDGSDEQKMIAEDNIDIITKLTRVPVLDVIPFVSELSEKHSREKGWEIVASHLKHTAEVLQSLKESEDITVFDQAHLWHPYSSAINASKSWAVDKAQSNYIYLKEGTKLLDGMSSWWCAIHGYGHPKLLQAINEQAAKMPHIMFGGLTHDPAVRLGKRLLEIVPEGLSHIFYADSGSVAVEVALKMARQYCLAQGFPNKTKFISLLGGYHGDTLGAMSVCDPVNGMHTIFESVLPKHIFAPRPSCSFFEEFNSESLAELKKLVATHQHECIGIVLEPIVQGAGGMWLYHPEYLKAVKKLCEEYGLLLIVDEIATGFGRTGKLFASNWAEITPDIMCIGKALTGGMMTLAATITTKKIAHGISDQGGVLMHGPTFMANPLACHVALASIDLLLSIDWKARVSNIEKTLKAGLAKCADSPDVADVRILGAIGVVQMKRKINVPKLQKFFVEQCGVWIRPFNDLIYIMPSFNVSEAEVLVLTRAITEAIEEQAWA